MIVGIDAAKANAAQRTGTEWYSWFLLKSLLPIIPEEHSVRLYFRDQPRADMGPFPANVSTDVLKWPPKRLWYHGRVSWEMFRRPPDVLFVPAHTIPLYLPKATVTTIHDVGFLRFPELYGWAERLYQQWSLNQAIRSATKIIVPSEFTRQELLSLTAVDPDRVTVVHHGFAASSVAVSHPVPSVPTPYVFFVGRLERKKGIVEFLHAFRQFLDATKSPHHFVAAGMPGYGYEGILETIQQLQLGDRVILLGYVDLAMVQRLRQGSAAFVFPSHYEGFGLPILEAFADGVPVLASTSGSIPEIAGSAAQLADIHDTQAWAAGLQKVLFSPDDRRRMIAAGHERLQSFTWGRAARQTWQIIKTATQ